MIAEYSGLRHIVSFLLVGAVGFAFDVGFSTVFVRELSLTPLIARAPAFLIASIVTFALNRRFTFKRCDVPFLSGWAAYFGSTSFGAFLNYAVFCILISVLPRTSSSILLAIAAGSVVGLGLNYSCARFFVFKPRGASH